jgi:tetratricopeptide (TPR) repeat protein
MFQFISSILCLFILSNCSSIKKTETTSIDKSEISEVARNTLQEARNAIRRGQLNSAISILAQLKDETLIPLEKSFKYNLKGVCHFGNDEVEKSLANFDIAAKYAPENSQIYSQIQLNKASAYYKLGQFVELKQALQKIDKSLLQNSEPKKYAQLSRFYALKFNDPFLLVTSSFDILAESKTLAEVMDSSIYGETKEAFDKLKLEEKNSVFEGFTGKRNIASAHFAQVEIESRYSNLDKSGAEELSKWLGDEFSDNEEIKKFVSDFEFRLQNSSKISLDSIGVILPMTGPKSTFGLKALASIDASLKLFGLSEKIKIQTKDSQDIPALGAEAVLNLVKEHHVSFIIGGLFPDTAKAEYLEAKKYGVLFISLSQVNLPKEEKNHHLIEVQGSVESQVEVLLSNSMIEKFGSRLGVIYPETDGGKAYMDEIWRQSKNRNLKVTSVAKFPKNTHDFRQTSEDFLGLKYPRERSEELRILEDVYSFEKSSIRRVQTLPPVLDFDWVFLATFPQETSQLVSTLGYYDANRLKVIGGPSWGSKSMHKEQKHLGTLFYIGDDPKDLNTELLTQFSNIYGNNYGLIEILSLDAMKIGSEIIRLTTESDDREEFDIKLGESSEIKGIASLWNLRSGLWLKKMNAMTISRGEFSKIFEINPVN